MWRPTSLDMNRIGGSLPIAFLLLEKFSITIELAIDTCTVHLP